MNHQLLFLDSLGGGELLLIFVFILLFFGSGKIPDLARGLGRGMREFKDAMSGVQRDIEHSIHETESRKDVAKQVAPPQEVPDEKKEGEAKEKPEDNKEL